MILKKIIILGFVLISILNVSQASSLSSQLRPYMEKIIGVSWSNKILGADTTLISLPPIPKMNEDAKSLDVYNKKCSLLLKLKISDKEHQKFNLSFVKEIYSATKNTRANKNELLRWMNVMSQGGGREGIYRAMVLDNYYDALERRENPLRMETINFAIHFLGKYIGQSVKKEALLKLNFYTLKRIIVEKALGVVGPLCINKDDLFNWYAILSAELAKDYDVVWRNKLRLKKDALKHKEWSENVSEEYIKSELIIKLHKTLNFLNKS